MSLKKSEDFLYFQSKASHYHNIVSAKSQLDTRPPQSLHHKIENHSINPAYKHEPHLRQFDVDFQNQKMLKRVLANQKSPINKCSTYARYNGFERSFRERNPHQKEQQRLIELQNKKLRRSIERAKSLVGSVDNWNKNHDNNVKHTQLLSKFFAGKQKNDILVQTDKFLPQKYLKYLENSQEQKEQENKSLVNSSRLKGKINVEKLFVLPQLHTHRLVGDQSGLSLSLKQSHIQRKSVTKIEQISDSKQIDQIQDPKQIKQVTDAKS